MTWLQLRKCTAERFVEAGVVAVVDDALRARLGLTAPTDHPAIASLTCISKTTPWDALAAASDTLVVGPVKDDVGRAPCTRTELIRDYARRRYLERPIVNPAYRNEGRCLWTFHIAPVAAYASDLAREAGQDPDLFAIAAYLHDIGRLDGDDGHHHAIGASLAAELLTALGGRKEDIDLVARAIRNHRGSVARDCSDPHGQILAAADGMATIEYFPLVFYSSFRKHEHGIAAGCEKAEDKLAKAWRKLPEHVKPAWRSRAEFLLDTLRRMS